MGHKQSPTVYLLGKRDLKTSFRESGSPLPWQRMWVRGWKGLQKVIRKQGQSGGSGAQCPRAIEAIGILSLATYSTQEKSGAEGWRHSLWVSHDGAPSTPSESRNRALASGHLSLLTWEACLAPALRQLSPAEVPSIKHDRSECTGPVLTHEFFRGTHKSSLGSAFFRAELGWG